MAEKTCVAERYGKDRHDKASPCEARSGSAQPPDSLRTFCLKCCSLCERSRYDRAKHCKFAVIIVIGRCDQSGRRAEHPGRLRTIKSRPESSHGAAAPAPR